MSDKPATMSAELVDLALGRWNFRHHDGETFALPCWDGEPAIAVPLRGGRSVRTILAREYREVHGRPPSQAALADALVVLEGEAEPEYRPVGLRVVRDADGVRWLDLGHPTGEVVKLDPATRSWQLTMTDRVIFRRTALTGELPVPVPGGDLDTLRKLVNVSDADWPLLVSLLVSALDPDVPHPVGAVTGQQGTGKSTLVRLLAQLVDPSPAPLRTSPRDLEQWAVAASGSWLVGLDNVSRMPEWLSDALCRAATGDGMVRRRLYSDADLSVLAFRRVVLLSYIDAGALRGDLADRLVTFELDRIDPSRRRTDEELAAAWRDAHPGVLGALLDLAAQAFHVLPEVRPARLSRMADFHRIVAAVDEVTGWSGQARYASLGERLAEEVVAGDPVAESISKMLDGRPGWSGTASELLDELDAGWPERKKKPRDWPGNGRAMAGALKRCAPALRTVGIEVDGPHRVGRDRDRTWTLTRVEEMATEPSDRPHRPSTDATDATDGPSRQLSTADADDADATDGLTGEASTPFPPCRICGKPTRDTQRQVHQRCVVAQREGAA